MGSVFEYQQLYIRQWIRGCVFGRIIVLEEDFIAPWVGIPVCVFVREVELLISQHFTATRNNPNTTQS